MNESVVEGRSRSSAGAFGSAANSASEVPARAFTKVRCFSAARKSPFICGAPAARRQHNRPLKPWQVIASTLERSNAHTTCVLHPNRLRIAQFLCTHAPCSAMRVPQT